MTLSFFLQMLLNGIQLASVYILVALGFTLIFGILHVVNMAHGSIFMIGGYMVWISFSILKLPFIFALFLTILSVGCFGLILERFIFRGIQGFVIPTVIASIGLMQVLEQSAVIVFGIDEKIVRNPFPGIIRFLGTVFPVQRLVIMLIAVILAAILVWWVQKTRAGLALRAVAQDRETAASYGISPDRLGMLAFGVGCGLAGAAGALVAPLYFVEPFMGGQPLLKMFTIVIIGGLGSIPGAIIGGLILGIIDSFVATMINSVVASMVGFALVIIILLVKPTGLLGHE